jgi:predicted ArsR family transcriptional regulator
LDSASKPLEQLLRLAAGRGTAQTAELARDLEVTPALVRQMLEELTRQGYLETVVAGCSTPCERCPLHAACLYRNQPRIWILTRKGEKWLAR